MQATSFGRTSVSVSKLEVIPSGTGTEDVGLEVQASGDIIVEVVVQGTVERAVMAASERILNGRGVGVPGSYSYRHLAYRSSVQLPGIE